MRSSCHPTPLLIGTLILSLFAQVIEVEACTVITVSKGDQVFFGGNDDYIHPDSYYWVDPGNGNHYGVVWIGQPDNVQQGINEKGLAYDSNGLPRTNVNPHTERLPVRGGYTRYPIQILHECATVKEVVDWVGSHAWHTFMHDQMHFADPTGDAVIISAGADGEVAFTRKPAGDGFLVSTNFNVVQPRNGFGYPCWRFDRAEELLADLVSSDDPLDVEAVADVLDAVHVADAGGWTLESMVADLVRGRIYLYYFHQFNQPLALDVQTELANPRAPGPLSELFPEPVRAEAQHRYQALQAQASRCQWISTLWLVLVGLSLVVYLLLKRRRGPLLGNSVTSILILGPMALALLVLIRGERTGDLGKRVMRSTLVDLQPIIVAFVVVLAVILLTPGIRANEGYQLIIVLVLPVLLVWCSRGFGLSRMVHSLVTANLGLAGISVLGMPLVNLSLRSCALLPASFWTFATWWWITVVSACIGFALLLGFESRQKKRQGATFQVHWGWILLSYLILAFGVVGGAVLGQVITG